MLEGDIVKLEDLPEDVSFSHVFNEGEPVTFVHPKTGKTLKGTITSVYEDHREGCKEELCDWITVETEDGKTVRITDDWVTETVYVRFLG
jgi:hypothetical protein